MNINELKEDALKNGLSVYIVGRSFYSQENGCKLDYAESFKWYKYGYQVLHDPRCQYGFAMFYFDDGESEPEEVVEKNNAYANELFADAYPKLKQLAKNDMYANFILGAYHNYGIGGVKKDFSSAIKFIRKSADLGHSGACYDMGKFFTEGRGVKQNLKLGLKYYQKAAQLGNIRAEEKIKEFEHKQKSN